MSYLGSFKIDDYVPIPAACHRFSTGAAYAATVLTYSIYEEGNDTGLDENVDMTPATPFDSIVGFYYARRQLTTAAGFEVGKSYVVVVKATVDSVAAIQWHTFQVAAAVNVAALGGTVQSATDLKDFADAGYDPDTNKVQGVVLTDTTTALTNGVTLADDSITASKFDESTAFPLKSADTGATGVARTGADSDTLETLSDQIDAAASANDVADAMLARDLGSGTGAGTLNERTVRSALRLLRNKRTVLAGVLTVKKENDTDDAWTAAVTGTSGADPITAIDPT